MPPSLGYAAQEGTGVQDILGDGTVHAHALAGDGPYLRAAERVRGYIALDPGHVNLHHIRGLAHREGGRNGSSVHGVGFTGIEQIEVIDRLAAAGKSEPAVVIGHVHIHGEMHGGEGPGAQIAEIGIQQRIASGGAGPAGGGVIGHYQVFGCQAFEEHIDLVPLRPGGLGHTDLEFHRDTGGRLLCSDRLFGTGEKSRCQAQKKDCFFHRAVLLRLNILRNPLGITGTVDSQNTLCR